MSHVPSNPFDKPAKFTVLIQPAALLGVCLVQLHGFMEQTGISPNSPLGVLQAARYALAYDVYLAHVPIELQKIGLMLIDPTLRLLGFERYNPSHIQRARARASLPAHT